MSVASTSRTSFQSTASASGGNGFSAPACTDTHRHDERADDRSCRDATCEAENADCGRTQEQVPTQIGGRRALRLEILQEAALLPEIADDRQQEPDRRDSGAPTRRDQQHVIAPRASGVARQLARASALRGQGKGAWREGACRARAPRRSPRRARQCWLR